MAYPHWSRILIDSSTPRPLFRKTPLTIMALARSIYNMLFRRTSTFAITIVVGAVLFERGFDQAGEAVFENINQGVSDFSVNFFLTRR